MKKYPIRCPVTAYLSVIDGHWKPLLLWHLQTNPLRFKDILSRVPDISTRVLTEQLNEMEEDKLISRTAYNETPPRVEYELTDYGRTLLLLQCRVKLLLQCRTNGGECQYSEPESDQVS